MRRKFFTLSVAMLVAAGATACVTTADAQNNGQNVRLGKSAYVDGPIVKPIAVIEDSRCPMNARCIWAGRVRLKALLIHPDGNIPIELTLGEEKPVFDGMLTLTAVMPERKTGKDISQRDYRFSFNFAGGI